MGAFSGVPQSAAAKCGSEIIRCYIDGVGKDMTGRGEAVPKYNCSRTQACPYEPYFGADQACGSCGDTHHVSHSITHWCREKLSSMMTDFVADAKAGRHREQGWPNTCYGMSKLGLIAYTKVRARVDDRCRLRREHYRYALLPYNHCCPHRLSILFRLLSGRRPYPPPSFRHFLLCTGGFVSSPTAPRGAYTRPVFSLPSVFIYGSVVLLGASTLVPCKQVHMNALLTPLPATRFQSLPLVNRSNKTV